MGTTTSPQQQNPQADADKEPCQVNFVLYSSSSQVSCIERESINSILCSYAETIILTHLMFLMKTVLLR